MKYTQKMNAMKSDIHERYKRDPNGTPRKKK